MFGLNAAELWETYRAPILEFAFHALGALVIILIGLRFAGWMASLVSRYAEKNDRIDITLGNFFASIVRWGVTAAVLITALTIFGVEPTAFVAVLGAMTLAIGLSMQGALGNIASGIMIMLFRPYKLGDYIDVAGQGGTVKDINLFQTVLATVDNVKVIIPNGKAIDDVIKNYSGYPIRRCDITYGIDYDDNMDKALGLVRDIVTGDERVKSDPEPFVKVTNLNDSSVDITVRAWCEGSDYWNLKFDLIKRVKEAFDANGISIPYPHTTFVQKGPVELRAPTETD